MFTNLRQITIFSIFLPFTPLKAKTIRTGDLVSNLKNYFNPKSINSLAEQLNDASIYQTITIINPNKRFHVLYINIKQPKLRLKFSPCGPRKNPFTWSQNNQVDIVINGNFFPGNPLTPRGIVIGEGQNCPGSISLEQPFLACDQQQNCFISADRSLQYSANIWNAVSGAWLIKGGEVHEKYQTCEGGKICRDLNPQTSIGLSAEKNYLISIVVEGRKEGASGVTRKDMAYIHKMAKIHDGILLDGGYSSIMLINGKAMTGQKPGNVRSVANLIGFKFVD